MFFSLSPHAHFLLEPREKRQHWKTSSRFNPVGQSQSSAVAACFKLIPPPEGSCGTPMLHVVCFNPVCEHCVRVAAVCVYVGGCVCVLTVSGHTAHTRWRRCCRRCRTPGRGAGGRPRWAPCPGRRAAEAEDKQNTCQLAGCFQITF